MVDLEQRGLLKRIKTPVSTELEMTEIQTRLLAEKGPAVLFENPLGANGKKFDVPVLVNLFGTVERVALGMGRSPEELREVGKMLAFLRQPEPPAGIGDALQKLPLLKSIIAMRPKKVKMAPCQEVLFEREEVDLTRYPIQTCWPNEPAPLITFPLVVTQGPDPVGNRSDSYNLGIYRMQVKSRNTTLMRWLAHRGGAQQATRWTEQKSDPIPVAAVIGADPATLLAAVTPVPDTLSEYQFAGLLKGKSISLVDCKTVPLKVPAEAEIVLEGHVDLSSKMPEGPYGDHTGYFNAQEPFPVFTVSAITQRIKPIYHSTFTGRPPDEPSILGEALNEVFIPLFQQQFPEIVDFWLPPEACSYRLAVVAIKKAYPGHAKRVMMAVWSYLRQFTYTKWVIVVDDTIDTRSWDDVIWAISTRMDPARDITVLEDTPIDYLDFASPVPGLGSKIGLDATDKWPPETKREWGRTIRMSDSVIEKIDQMWGELGLPGKGRAIWK